MYRFRQPLRGLVSGWVAVAGPMGLATIGVIESGLSVRTGYFDRLPAFGLFLVVIAGLSLALGDRLPPRLLMFTLSGATLLAAVLIAVAAWLAAAGFESLARAAAVIGLGLSWAGSRYGDMTIVRSTPGLSPRQRLRVASTQGGWQIIASSVPLLCVSLIFAVGGARMLTNGWGWIFAGYGVVLFGLVLFSERSTISSDPPPPDRGPAKKFSSGFAALFAEPRLLAAGAGAFFARVSLMLLLTGIAVLLAGRGFPPQWSALVIAGTLLAAPLVFAMGRDNRLGRLLKSRRRLGAFAGLVPTTVAVLMLIAPVRVGIAGVAVALNEVHRRVSQLVGMTQVDVHSLPTDRYRRQTVLNLFGNLGALTGAGLGPLCARAGEVVWAQMLLASALLTWLLQAGWFLAGRSRQRSRVAAVEPPPSPTETPSSIVTVPSRLSPAGFFMFLRSEVEAEGTRFTVWHRPNSESQDATVIVFPGVFTREGDGKRLAAEIAAAGRPVAIAWITQALPLPRGARLDEQLAKVQDAIARSIVAPGQPYEIWAHSAPARGAIELACQPNGPSRTVLLAPPGFAMTRLAPVLDLLARRLPVEPGRRVRAVLGSRPLIRLTRLVAGPGWRSWLAKFGDPDAWHELRVAALASRQPPHLGPLATAEKLVVVFYARDWLVHITSSAHTARAGITTFVVDGGHSASLTSPANTVRLLLPALTHNRLPAAQGQ